MGYYKTKFLTIFIIVNFLSSIYSKNIDKICGNWANLWNKDRSVYESLSVEKLSDKNFFVSFLTLYGDHTLDFAGIATVFDENKLLYKHKLDDGTEENFFIYFDFDMDYTYVLWNHEVPDYEYYDVQLERVSKLYDEEYQKALEEESQEKLNKAIIDWIKNP